MGKHGEELYHYNGGECISMPGHLKVGAHVGRVGEG